ncbi:MAG: prolyl oligopeptidase family serine peptidase [Oceanipulchritudo sp.]
MPVRYILFLNSLLAASLLIAEDKPLSYFFDQPSFEQARMSPDGTHLAILFDVGGAKNLGVINFEDNKPTPITAQKEDISWFHWANNERIVYGMDSETDVFARQLGGIFAVNKDGSRHRTLVMPVGTGAEGVTYQARIPRYLGPDPQSDRRILVSRPERSYHHPDVFSLDVYTGREKGHMVNTIDARYFTTDVNDEIRFGFRTELVGQTEVFIRDPDSGEWEELIVLPETDAYWRPLDFSPGRDTFLVSTNLGRDKKAVVRFNWKSGESETVLSDPIYDIDPSPIMAIRRKDKVAGLYYQADKLRYKYFEEQHRKLQALIDEALPDTFNRILEVNEAGTELLIQTISDRAMASYHRLKLDGLQLEKLVDTAPWIKPGEMPAKRPISFEASDGKTVHGYLILPGDYEAGKPVPMIVHPHGGPWARDVWHIRWYGDMEPYFYADRGFAVLQVNFRGSTGYGQAFLRESERNIERMVLDTVEGARWAISEGYAHPERVGIGGASWGGYKTMISLVKYPDFFKFGINLFGVVDLPLQMERYLKWERDLAYDYWVERFGDPKIDDERDYLLEWSPITHIDQLRAPVFVYHGIRDLNVDIEQSRLLVRALERHDLPYERIFDTDEMHSMSNIDTRMRLYRAIDEFLVPFREKWGLMD